MEREQTSFELVSANAWREKIAEAKKKFRSEERNLSFNEKMKIAFKLNERDKQLKEAKKK